MKIARLALLIFILLSSILVNAQSEDIYTFDTGVSFSIPAGAELDDVDPPALYFGDLMVIEMVEPEFIGVTAADTIGVPLDEVLTYLLGLVGYSDPIIPANGFSETLVDGREVLGYVFVNVDDLVQTVVVVRFSDDSVGALNIRSVDALTAADQTMLRALAVSFDVPGDAAPAPTAPVKATPVPAPTVAAVPTIAPEADELAQTFAYESGVSFSFPADYIIENQDDPPASIGIPDVIFITMVDPNVVGMPAGQSLQSIIDFAVRNLPIDPTSFEPFDVGGREAAYGFAPSDPYIQSMVLVRFSDDTMGIMDIVTNTPLEGELLEDVRAIAASFDSASDVASGPSADALEQAVASFEEGLDLYDSDDFESAIPLFDEAIALDPSWPLPVYWRGAANQNSGNLEAALVDFEQALAMEPDERQILVDIADTQALLNLMDEAVATLEDYAADPGDDTVDPNLDFLIDAYSSVAAGEYNSDLYYGRSIQLRAYGRYEEALRDVLVAITNEPTDPILYALHGSILVDMDRDQEAVSVLTKGLTIEPISVLFLNRAYAYQNMVMTEFNAMIDSAYDFQCVLLTADDTVTTQQLEEAERALNRMIISSDDYEPITDVADCAA